MSGETFDYGFSQSADVDLPVIDTFDSPFSPLNMSDIALWTSAFADSAHVFAGDSDEQTPPPLSPLLSPPRILDDPQSTSGSTDALMVLEAPLSKKPRYVRAESKRSTMTIPMSDLSAVTSPSSTPSPSIPSSPVPSLDSHSAYSLQSANGSDDEYNRGDGDVNGDVGLRDRRLARKAELARLSRKRKRTRLDDLTNQCKTLQTQLSQLKRAQHSAATTVTVEPIRFDVNNITADSLEALATSLEQRQALATDMMERVTELIKPVALIDSVVQAMSSATSTDAGVRAIVPRADEETVSHIAALRTTLNKQRRFDADAQRLAARLTGMLNKINKQRAANLERIRSAMETDQINAVIKHANKQ